MSSLPSRRAVVRTAAWTLPVVSVAAAAPAFAGTGGETPPAQMGTVVRSGNTYTVPITVNETESQTYTVVMSNFGKKIINATAPTGWVVSITQPAGGSTGSVTYTHVATSTGTISLSLTVESGANSNTISVDLASPTSEHLGTFVV